MTLLFLRSRITLEIFVSGFQCFILFIHPIAVRSLYDVTKISQFPMYYYTLLSIINT